MTSTFSSDEIEYAYQTAGVPYTTKTRLERMIAGELPDVYAETFLESAVLIGDKGQALYWHVPEGRTAVSLPDSPDLWAAIWANREAVVGIAHTHPGTGQIACVPSAEDLSTFRAIDAALGRGLVYWIVTENDATAWRLGVDGSLTPYNHPLDCASVLVPGFYPWLEPLRAASRASAQRLRW